MMAATAASFIFVIFVLVVLVNASQPLPALGLERRAPGPRNHFDLSMFMERDTIRHQRMLKQQHAYAGIGSFHLEGSFDPAIAGIYYAKVQLGTPPRDLYVEVDTWSEVSWVSCSTCAGCRTQSGTSLPGSEFDPNSSSTASTLWCWDNMCEAAKQWSDATCSIDDRCSYIVEYADKTATSGYFVTDMLQYEAVSAGYVTPTRSVPIIFGCSTIWSGEKKGNIRVLDGLLGLGYHEISIVSQLASKGLTPRVFSHCLRRDGGGNLVFGEILSQNIVFSPMIRSSYMIKLRNASINGQSVLAPLETMVDMGTSLVYMPESIYQDVVSAISLAVAHKTQQVDDNGTHCYVYDTSLPLSMFPEIVLNFVGGASMILRPRDYLIQKQMPEGTSKQCICFLVGEGGLILGELSLRDKIVVYDIANQRIGWADHDCSTRMNVSLDSNQGFHIAAGHGKMPLLLTMLLLL